MSRPEFLALPGASTPVGPPRALQLRRPDAADVAPLDRGPREPIELSKARERRTEAEKIRSAARQFEAVFMSYLYKSMRETVPDSPFAGEGQTQGMYEDLFTQSLGASLAGDGSPGRGLGLAEMLIQNLEPKAARALASQLDRLENEAAATSAAGKASGAAHGPVVRAGGGRALHSGIIGAIAPTSAPGAAFGPFMAAPPDRLSVGNAEGARKEMPALADNVRVAIDQAAEATGVDRNLLRAVALVESNGNPNAESRRGARGLMQLMEGTARELGVKNVFDPLENALAGARYLKRMLLNNGGDERLALASYNAGPGNVRRHGGVPPFKETINYIERVLDVRQRLGGGNT